MMAAAAARGHRIYFGEQGQISLTAVASWGDFVRSSSPARPDGRAWYRAGPAPNARWRISAPC